jgi:molybdopterin-containing oxidoreductase family molybdopterin binding subunit
MRLIVFDPFLSTQASTAEEWVPIKAGTDAAAALCMANLLLNEYGMFDRDYIKSKTNGPYLVAPDGLYRRDKVSGVPLVYNALEKRVEPFNSDHVNDCALEGEFKVDGTKCTPSFQLLKNHLRKYSPDYASKIC